MGLSKFHLFFVFLAFGAVALLSCGNTEVTMANGSALSKEGSRCTYISYSGKAEFTRIAKTPNSAAQANVLGGPGYEGYDVWFRFHPEPDLPSDHLRSLVSRNHLLKLTNGWYPGQRYLKKYGITEGITVPCRLNVLQEGTCAPHFFEFPGIDRSDYFESHH
jgi:hypothetical protein